MSDDLSIPNAGSHGHHAGRYGLGHGRSRRGMDPGTRRLVMFASGLAIVLLTLIGISTLTGHHSNAIPVIVADTRPIRVKPDNPGGMKIDGAENDVFSGGSDTANARLSPAAEKPDTKALHIAEAPPSPVVTPTIAMTAAAPPLPVAEPAAVPAVPTPRPVVLPAPTPAALPATKPRAAAVEAQQSVSGHPTMVQLAALGSEEAARMEWQQLTKRLPELFSGRQPSFSRTERDGHVFWRVRTAGFADTAQARSFCAQVRAKGGGCSIADF